jgi:hypothetical protein
LVLSSEWLGVGRSNPVPRFGGALRRTRRRLSATFHTFAVNNAIAQLMV